MKRREWPGANIGLARSNARKHAAFGQTQPVSHGLQGDGFQPIGQSEKCRVQFHAITAERRIAHPAVALITSQARVMMKD